MSDQIEKAIDLETLGAEIVADYYNSPTEKFLVKNKAGRWLPHSVTGFKRVLSSRGISSNKTEGKPLSPADSEILTIQDENDVTGHGPICGRNAGFINEGGTRYLVTEDMDLIEPKEGSAPTINALIKGLLYQSETEETGDAQVHTFLGWLKSSVEALRAGRRQQQQALAICGARDCGKSFIQHHIITPCLAGRSADASGVFLRQNDFNSNLFKAEHLVLDDNHSSTAIKDRLAFGAAIKVHTVGSTVKGLHAKGREEMNIAPWWRISITLNDSPEAMMILPPLNEDVEDKIIILRASQFDFPEPIESGDDKERFTAKLRSEIPAFLYWLLNSHEIPDQYVDPRRYNVATFHHPELKEALERLSPQAELLELIDTTNLVALVSDNDVTADGVIWITAEKLEEQIRIYHDRRAKELFSYRGACAKYLHRLAVKMPKRISKSRTSAANGWLIRPK